MDEHSTRVAGFAAAVAGGALATLSVSGGSPAQVAGRLMMVLCAIGLVTIGWSLVSTDPATTRGRSRGGPARPRPRSRAAAPNPFAIARLRLGESELPRPSLPTGRPFAQCRMHRAPRPS